MLSWLQSLLWSLARHTPQHEALITRWAKMHGRLMTDTTKQQRANFTKKRKLRGLRAGKRNLECSIKRLNCLNGVHGDFVDTLEREHPELYDAEP